MNTRCTRRLTGAALFAIAAAWLLRSHVTAKTAKAGAELPSRSEPPALLELVPARVTEEKPAIILPASLELHPAVDAPTMGAHGDDSLLGPRHPHPLTPRHARIFRENSLLAALNGALDVASAEALHDFNRTYQQEFPEDEQQLQAGYELIADCLERSDEETRRRATEYFEEERASTLRRYVKRYCLE